MIVRNEAHVIERCLRSVKPYVCAWGICDTGSTDGTQERIRDLLADLPGELRESKWVDFATNRNEALELARKFGTDYLLIIDADEELHRVADGAFDTLGAEAYVARFILGGPAAEEGVEQVWCRKLLLRTDVPWRYKGAIHEYLELPGIVSQVLPGVAVMSHHDSARNKLGAAEKSRRDARLLKREINKDPKNPRLWFYYGMSLAGAQKIDAAIEAYRHRVKLGGGFPEEIFASLFQIAALRDFRGDDWRDVVHAYLQAYNARPTRAEPLFAAAVLFAEHGELASAELFARAACRVPPPSDSLIVLQDVYMWRAADELAGILGRMGRVGEARSILERLVELPQCPEAQRPRIRENIEALKRAAA